MEGPASVFWKSKSWVSDRSSEARRLRPRTCPRPCCSVAIGASWLVRWSVGGRYGISVEFPWGGLVRSGAERTVSGGCWGGCGVDGPSEVNGVIVGGGGCWSATSTGYGKVDSRSEEEKV